MSYAGEVVDTLLKYHGVEFDRSARKLYVSELGRYPEDDLVYAVVEHMRITPPGRMPSIMGLEAAIREGRAARKPPTPRRLTTDGTARHGREWIALISQITSRQLGPTDVRGAIKALADKAGVSE